MDFKDQIKILSERVAKLKENIGTEEATKTALIMPFIQALGYDIFDPTEVTPECTCDVGLKKGEKVDYTIFKDGNPIIIVECKHWKQDINLHNEQLFRYFHVSAAKFGLLTNGIIYRFYTDLIEPNKMDEKPFFEVNLEDLRDIHVEKLKEFHKSYFNIESILNTASELKFTNEIKSLIVKEVNEPSDEFIKYFAKQVYPSMMTKVILDQFRDIVKRAFQQYNSDYINDRLKSVIKSENIDIKVSEEGKHEEFIPNEDRVMTTEEEKQGLYIVKSILHRKIDLNRIFCRDTISYFGILLDDNNRKPICRLHLNGGKKYLETFDEEKKGTKYPIETIEDIYSFSDEVIASACNYVKEEQNN